MISGESTFNSRKGGAMVPVQYSSPVHPNMNGQYMNRPMKGPAPPVAPYAPQYGYEPHQYASPRLPLAPMNQYVGFPSYGPPSYASPVHPIYTSIPQNSGHDTRYGAMVPIAEHHAPFQPMLPFLPNPNFSSRLARSQPAVRRQVLSDSGSSDSDEAQEISDRIMKSVSNDPRELKSIIKSAHRKHDRREKPKNRSRSEFPTNASEKAQRRKARRPMRDNSAAVYDGLSVVYEENEIPAASFDNWFDDDEIERRERPNKREENSRKPPKEDRQKFPKEKRHKRPVERARSVSHAVHSTAIVPAHVPARRVAAPKLANDKQTIWWNATVSGKRQRLPPADWRKGERYISAPDGTKVGLTGWKEVVCDDTLGWKHKRASKHSGMSTAASEDERPQIFKKPRKNVDARMDTVAKLARMSTSSVDTRRSVSPDNAPKPARRSTGPETSVRHSASFENAPKPARRSTGSEASVRRSTSFENAPKPARKSTSDNAVIPARMSTGSDKAPKPASVSTAERPILNAFDFMKKNKEGIYCLGSFKLLQRRGDRMWGAHDDENGFATCASISTREISFAEVALDPNMPTGKSETLDENTSIILRVMKSAPNAIRVQINDGEERLNEEDEMRIHARSTYSITNLSKERTAILSMALMHK